jgi:hypothetical protein
VVEMENTIIVNGFEFDLTEKMDRVEKLLEEFKNAYGTGERLEEYKAYVLTQLEGKNERQSKLYAPQMKALEILGV